MESFLRPAFEANFGQFKRLMSSSAAKKNKASALYSNKARAVLFRLEALSRICRSVYSKKKFNPLYDDFKTMEDGLGVIEFYDDFHRQFSSIRQLPKKFIGYFASRREEETEKLNQRIRENESDSKTFFGNFDETINNTPWLTGPAERETFIDFMIRQTEIISRELDSGILNFNALESGVHEVRRKIRWLSIYAAVVEGVVQLHKTKSVNKFLKPYLTPEIVNLPYNQFPPPPRTVKPVLFQSQNFYALSWVINELGNLKDEGLTRFAVEEALKANPSLNKIKIRKTLLKSLRSVGEICDQAENVVDEFVFYNGILDRLMRDLKRSKVNPKIRH